jgi:DNA (cytosine-5)-methyltransferase 1
MQRRLILSIFPGIGLLDRAFEEAGHCVLRGPDLLWGGDVRNFFPPSGHFWGVIGGPPCQDFSSLRRAPPTGEGLEMLEQFCRVVRDAAPEWWLLENVSRVPDVEIAGYHCQRLDVDQRWWSDVTRLRHIQFGSRSGRMLHIDRGHARSVTGDPPDRHGAALASDNRPFDELLRLQGLPADFDLPPFKANEKKRAVGNGVPLVMGRALAAAVDEAYGRNEVTLQKTLDGGSEVAGVCRCGCGRRLLGKQRYYDFSCRKRAQRKRDTAQSQGATSMNRGDAERRTPP